MHPRLNPQPKTLLRAVGARVSRVGAILGPQGKPLDTDDGIDAPGSFRKLGYLIWGS